MNVELVRWPSDPQRLAGLRDSRVPRLLLVSDGSEPPVPSDCLEDWVGAGASESALEARCRALQARARAHAARPVIDSDGLLRHHDIWVSLSPVEQALTRELLERFDAVVPRDVLAGRAWPDGAPTRNALDVHVLRLRRRLAPLGLEIRTVRSRGYLLQESR
jgi:two-component system OmpR family response regulator